jgi:hypothetical protein
LAALAVAEARIEKIEVESHVGEYEERDAKPIAGCLVAVAHAISFVRAAVAASAACRQYWIAASDRAAWAAAAEGKFLMRAPWPVTSGCRCNKNNSVGRYH